MTCEGSIPFHELTDEWLALDKDPETRAETCNLLMSGPRGRAEIELRFRNRIAFGTAGLRARMEAGFGRLNSLTIIQASQGLAAYVLEQIPDAKGRGIVVGRDARHNSEKFAKLTAAAFVAKGVKVWWYESPVHTPFVPFGVRRFRAAAGVMITASHNPAQDNGYKVYWENGCQIIPPHDAGIAASIEQNLQPVTWDTSVVKEGNLLVEASPAVADPYCQAVMSASRRASVPDTAYPPFVYTPMHGVGLVPMTKVLETLGLTQNMIVVSEQAQPDPDFPTVKFPNPEEKGALDLAMATADAQSISLILASDPDADRLAVAEKVDGKWYQFTGNQLGILLAAHLYSTHDSTYPKDKVAMLASTVSSQMLHAMAQSEGFHFSETLTGFKWLGNVSLDLEEKGYDVLFAFEEAIGYMIASVAHDKDAISSAAVFLNAAADWQYSEYSTPYQILQQLYRRYGYFEDANTYLISPSPETTTAVFNAIRALGSPHPQQLGSRKILRWRDLTVGYDSSTQDHVPDLPVDKSSQMITCDLEGDVRFTVRGSGTEPKIKLYVEGKADSSRTAKAAAEEVVKDLLTEWFKPEENGLKLA